MDGMNFGGYAYALAGVATECWEDCADAYWEVEMAAADEKRAIRELGTRNIDGVRCMVFECADTRVRAVTMVAAQAVRSDL